MSDYWDIRIRQFRKLEGERGKREKKKKMQEAMPSLFPPVMSVQLSNLSVTASLPRWCKGITGEVSGAMSDPK